MSDRQHTHNDPPGALALRPPQPLVHLRHTVGQGLQHPVTMGATTIVSLLCSDLFGSWVYLVPFGLAVNYAVKQLRGPEQTMESSAQEEFAEAALDDEPGAGEEDDPVVVLWLDRQGDEEVREATRMILREQITTALQSFTPMPNREAQAWMTQFVQDMLRHGVPVALARLGRRSDYPHAIGWVLVQRPLAYVQSLRLPLLPAHQLVADGDSTWLLILMAHPVAGWKQPVMQHGAHLPQEHPSSPRGDTAGVASGPDLPLPGSAISSDNAADTQGDALLNELLLSSGDGASAKTSRMDPVETELAGVKPFELEPALVASTSADLKQRLFGDLRDDEFMFLDVPGTAAPAETAATRWDRHLAELVALPLPRRASTFAQPLVAPAPEVAESDGAPDSGTRDRGVVGPAPATDIALDLRTSTSPAEPVALPEPPAPRASSLPSTELLRVLPPSDVSDADLDAQQQAIVAKLATFKVEVRVMGRTTGPTVTQFEVEPAPGVKVKQITGLEQDLALALAVHAVRIEAPILGKPLIGIEVPRPIVSVVGLREVISSPAFTASPARLKIPLGKTVVGAPVVVGLEKMPHLLIAGATGSGKSVAVNALLVALLMQYGPEDLRLLLVDPKMVELVGYDGIPHLITPVISEMKKVAPALRWATREMERRYKVFARYGVRNLEDYRRIAANDASVEHMPFMVIVIDELADLMMTAPDETEQLICRLAQMARAAGIHLIVATQRPSVDVVTGLIKANFPSRIAFAVTSLADSRVILDAPGADQLLGRGDMLYMAADSAKLVRIQGAYLSDQEVQQVVRFWRSHTGPRPPTVDLAPEEETPATDTSTTADTPPADAAPEEAQPAPATARDAEPVPLALVDHNDVRMVLGYQEGEPVYAPLQHGALVRTPGGDRTGTYFLIGQLVAAGVHVHVASMSYLPVLRAEQLDVAPLMGRCASLVTQPKDCLKLLQDADKAIAARSRLLQTDPAAMLPPMVIVLDDFKTLAARWSQFTLVYKTKKGQQERKQIAFARELIDIILASGRDVNVFLWIVAPDPQSLAALSSQTLTMLAATGVVLSQHPTLLPHELFPNRSPAHLVAQQLAARDWYSVQQGRADTLSIPPVTSQSIAAWITQPGVPSQVAQAGGATLVDRPANPHHSTRTTPHGEVDALTNGALGEHGTLVIEDDTRLLERWPLEQRPALERLMNDPESASAVRAVIAASARLGRHLPILEPDGRGADRAMRRTILGDPEMVALLAQARDHWQLSQNDLGRLFFAAAPGRVTTEEIRPAIDGWRQRNASFARPLSDDDKQSLALSA